MKTIAIILAIVTAQVMTPEYCSFMAVEGQHQQELQHYSNCQSSSCCKMMQQQSSDNKKGGTSCCSYCPKKILSFGPEISATVDVLHLATIDVSRSYDPHQKLSEVNMTKLDHPPPQAILCIWRN